MLCGSFWWRDVFKLADSYRAIPTATVNQGDSILFWSDSWILHNSNRPLRDRLPHLFSFVKDDKISAMDFLDSEDVTSMFHLPISSTAASELDHLLLWVTMLQRDATAPDVWFWPSKTGYSAKIFYTIMHTTFRQLRLVFGFGEVHAR